MNFLTLLQLQERMRDEKDEENYKMDTCDVRLPSPSG